MNLIRQKQHGLTLVELLLIVVLIAILALLVLPLGSKLAERSKAVGCANNMRQVSTALLLYRAEHNGYFPPGKAISYKDLGDKYGGVIQNALLGGEYLKEMPVCPAARLINSRLTRAKWPDEKKRLKELGSYGINAFVLSTRMEALPGPYWPGPYPNENVEYPGHSRVVFLTERTDLSATYALEHLAVVLGGYAAAPSRLTAPREHGNLRLNFMFLDGHMELLGAKKVDENSTKVDAKTYDWSEHFSRDGANGTKFLPTFVADSVFLD